MIIATHGIVASQIVTVPVATAATSVTDTSFVANWNAYTGAGYYLLDVSLNSSFSSFVSGYQNFVASTNSTTVTGLTSNTTYYYRVRAVTGVDSDVSGFVSRVYTAGGTLSYTEVTATETLVASMKSYGIWSKMKAIYPMVGASSAACSQNLKSSSFTGSFSSGWTFASTGVTPNGTSAYMNTGLSPTVALTNYSAHSSIYNRLTGGNSGFEMGITNSGGGYNQEFLLATYRGGESISAFYDYGVAAGEVKVASISGKGFFNGSITSNTLQKLYKNGTAIGNKTLTNNTTPSNYPIYIGAVNNQNSGAVEYNTNQYAFASIGDGLNDTEASNFYTAVQTFNQTLNRQV